MVCGMGVWGMRYGGRGMWYVVCGMVMVVE